MTKRVNLKIETHKIRNIVCMLLLIGLVTTVKYCSAKDTTFDSLVFSVDQSKVYLNEMMYHTMLEELQGELYASFLEGEIKDYWDIKAENGKTMREIAKENSLENAIKYELFYQKALEDNYTLTEEEEKASLDKVENILKNVPEDQLVSDGLSKEKLIEIQEKITVATNYYNKYIDSIVNKETIQEGINLERYEQYEIEYIYGTKEQKDKVVELMDQAGSDLVYSGLAKESGLKSGELTFLRGEGTFGEEDNLEAIITSMEAGQVSDLIETVRGYYIIKLKDNTSRSMYEKAVEDAVNEAVTLAFDENYKRLKNEYDITINTKVWKSIVIGN